MSVPMRSVRIPDDLWDAVKTLAAKRDVPIGHVVLEALRAITQGAQIQEHQARFEELAARFGQLHPASNEFHHLQGIVITARERNGRPKPHPLSAEMFSEQELDAIEVLLTSALEAP